MPGDDLDAFIGTAKGAYSSRWYCLRQPCALLGVVCRWRLRRLSILGKEGTPPAACASDGAASDALGLSVTNKLRQVYTGALLATTISADKEG